MQIIVDIDGPNKGKGMLGKDVFSFVFRAPNASNIGTQQSGIYAFGAVLRGDRSDYMKTESSGCNKDAPSPGYYCAALIMIDGWKISSDYPW